MQIRPEGTRSALEAVERWLLAPEGRLASALRQSRDHPGAVRQLGAQNGDSHPGQEEIERPSANVLPGRLTD